MNPAYLRYRLSRWHTEDAARALLHDCRAAGVRVVAVRRLRLGPVADPAFGRITDVTASYQLPVTNARKDKP